MTNASPPAYQNKKQKPGGAARFIVWLVFLALVAGGVYLIFFKPKGAADSKGPGGGRGAGRSGGGGPVVIATATAQTGDIGDYVKRIGNVVPVYTATVYAQVTGVVKTVYYKEGQPIKQGDPLVDLDSSLYDAALEQAKGTLDKDTNVLAKDEKDLERYEEAWKLNAIAKQILDDQRLQVEQDKGVVRNDQGVVDYDQAQVNYCHITAPVTGRVGLRLVDPGNLVSAGANTNAAPLAVITQMTPITAVFSVPEANGNLAAVLNHIKSSAPDPSPLVAELYDSTDTKKIATGEFIALDSQIDTSTGAVKARAQFDNEDFELFPNQFVNVHLLVRMLTGVTLVPTAAIQQNGETSFVYVIQDGTAHVRNVTVGIYDDKRGVTQVDGLNGGEVIADSSFDKLQNNSKVVLQGSKSFGGDKGKRGGGKAGDSPAASGTGATAADDQPSPSPGASSSPSASGSPNGHRHHGGGGGDNGGASNGS